ncbi:MAG TPA: hypothetical protein VJ731_12440 [Terriglobales bacterium]|nr:hypothetical protein [Terriglobales bacterium]
MNATTAIITNFIALLPPGEGAGATVGGETTCELEVAPVPEGEATEDVVGETGRPHFSQNFVCPSVGEPQFSQKRGAASG